MRHATCSTRRCQAAVRRQHAAEIEVRVSRLNEEGRGLLASNLELETAPRNYCGMRWQPAAGKLAAGVRSKKLIKQMVEA